MSGIPVHTSSPINPTAAKASAPTPTTTASPSSPTSSSRTPAYAPATATATATSSYPDAQPGSTGFPAPTQSAQPQNFAPTPTVPPPPTSTFSMPPAPQPGAVPHPSNVAPRPATSVPPPPKANDFPNPASTFTPQQAVATATSGSTSAQAPPPLPLHQQYPNLNATASINRAQPPASATSYDLSHPPGYVQDPQASFADRPIEPYRPFESNTTQSQGTSTGAGLLGGLSSDNSTGGAGFDNDKGMWETAKDWAKTAGQKLSQGEQEVWKAINGEK